MVLKVSGSGIPFPVAVGGTSVDVGRGFGWGSTMFGVMWGMLVTLFSKICFARSMSIGGAAVEVGSTD